MVNVTVRNPANGDVRVIPDVIAGRYEARGFEPITDDAAEAPPVEELKGEALDDALKAAGLPTTGKAAEKRARLAEHQAQ